MLKCIFLTTPIKPKILLCPGQKTINYYQKLKTSKNKQEK